MVKTRTEINRAIFLLIIVIFVALWVLVNSGQLVIAGIVFIAMPMIGIFLYRQWRFFGRKGDLEGIGDDWIKDAFIGIGFAVGFIALGEIGIPGIGSIGLPPVQSIASDIGRILIILVAAPFAEELIFRDLLHDFIDEKFKNLPFIIAALGNSILFALYHFSVYGASLQAAQGSFITAMVAGIGFSYLNKFTNSNASNIAAHIVLNIWLGFFVLAII